MKNKFTLILILLAAHIALALPVVNENRASSGVITIYPDHQDPDRFYIAPNVVTLARDKKGRPQFSYVEYRKGWFQKKALVQMTLVPYYTRDELDGAEKKILEANPKAQFSGLPFTSSHIDFADALTGLVESQDCVHESGLIGQEISCAFTLTPQGRDVFLTLIKRRILVTTMNYQYGVAAVIRNAAGTFEPYNLVHGIAARIDGGQILAYPELMSKK